MSRQVKKIYFASPFFNPEQVEREEYLKQALRDLGFEVFSPKECFHCPPDADDKTRQKTFEGNCEELIDCDLVFAVTDGKDMGTIWEAGFAYAINKPIIYFCETLGDGQFNLMLAQSGNMVYQNRSCLTNPHAQAQIRKCMQGKKVFPYRGEVE